MPRRSGTKLSGVAEVCARVLAEETRRLRGARTQRVAADLLGIARPNYSRTESGTHEPSLSTLIRNVTALGGDPRAVLERILVELDPTRPKPAPPPPRPKVEQPRGFALPERKR